VTREDKTVAYPQLLKRVLAGINTATPVSMYDYDGTGEWFRLESDDLWDYQLYDRLCRRWYGLVGGNSPRFALIHCMEGDEAGVWVHFLETSEARSEYLPGYHQVGSWA
jgi:hypothetical protein